MLTVHLKLGMNTFKASKHLPEFLSVIGEANAKAINSVELKFNVAFSGESGACLEALQRLHMPLCCFKTGILPGNISLMSATTWRPTRDFYGTKCSSDLIKLLELKPELDLVIDEHDPGHCKRCQTKKYSQEDLDELSGKFSAQHSQRHFISKIADRIR